MIDATPVKPEKERYQIYVSREVGAALRNEKAKARGVSFSEIVERAIRDQLRVERSPELASAS